MLQNFPSEQRLSVFDLPNLCYRVCAIYNLSVSWPFLIPVFARLQWFFTNTKITVGYHCLYFFYVRRRPVITVFVLVCRVKNRHYSIWPNERTHCFDRRSPLTLWGNSESSQKQLCTIRYESHVVVFFFCPIPRLFRVYAAISFVLLYCSSRTTATTTSRTRRAIGRPVGTKHRVRQMRRVGVQGSGIDCGYKFISYSDCPGLRAPQFSRDFLYY